MSQTTISAVLHRDLNTTPHTVFSASGHYLKLSDGAGGTRTVLDATGGAAVSCIGHCHPRVIAAMQEQISSLDYCASMFFSHAAGEALGTFLAESTGGKLPLSLILSSGSEAMETALKLARQYFLELPEPQEQRVRFIARNESYHGNSLGALGVGGHRSRRAKYEPLLSSNVSFVSACNAYRGMEEGESVAEYVARLKEELDQEFVRVGSDTVCAFVAEPVVGAAAGCVPAVEGYFKALREVCEKHGALLILDEVMCGMGRTGTLHAWEQEDVVPDIQTIGKGLGGGYTPAAAILVGKKVSDVLQSGSG
jgi:adenosylmethionine-8-amino-7-oxononanoate aminotransferase